MVLSGAHPSSKRLGRLSTKAPFTGLARFQPLNEAVTSSVHRHPRHVMLLNEKKSQDWRQKYSSIREAPGQPHSSTAASLGLVKQVKLSGDPI